MAFESVYEDGEKEGLFVRCKHRVRQGWGIDQSMERTEVQESASESLV